MRSTSVFLTVVFVVLCAGYAFAQDAAAPVSGPVAVRGSVGNTFYAAVASGGVLGLLVWLGILFWAVLVAPLGILSIIHSAMIRRRQWPLATKLLGCGAATLFVLGWYGFVLRMMSVFSTMATAGAASSSLLAMGISQSLYSVAGSLLICLHYLFFLSLSVLVVHFKHRKLLLAE